MSKIKNLRGQCQHCGGPIEFHAESAGSTADCPHCNQPTELLLETPPDESSPLRTKAIVFTIIAVVILIGGLVAASVALKRAKRMRAEQKQLTAKSEATTAAPLDPFARNGFRVSAVALGKGQGSSIVYATGSISNMTSRQRFGVKVELELLNDAGVKVGAATDYQSVMEAGAKWNYRAMVVEKKAVTAKVSGVNESAR